MGTTSIEWTQAVNQCTIRARAGVITASAALTNPLANKEQSVMANSQPTSRPRPGKFRSDNPNWRGGRSVASNGYVIVRVGTDHHLADVRGYAYEHRLIAEQKLGRRLLPGELVHHRDGNRQNNSSDNLLVCENNAEHFVHHRNRDDLQMPGEDNPIIQCECGCGQSFNRYDDTGRPRRFVSGHNQPPTPTQDRVLGVMSSTPMHVSTISELSEVTRPMLKSTLSRMRKCGRVENSSRGMWRKIG